MRKNNAMEPITVITGRIVHGKGIGRTVGMPTANLLPSSSSMIPPEGVYASVVHLRSGTYIGVTNIGPRPSVDNSPRETVETNILDFDSDIYGEDMVLDVMTYLRPVRKMADLEEVKRQVDEDKERARTILSGIPVSSSI